MKRSYFLMLLAALLCLTGCGGTSTEPVSELPMAGTEAAAAVTPEPTETPALPPFEKLDWSIVSDTPAGDFTYETVPDYDPETYDEIDAVRLISYNGSDTIIKIPAEIDGMPVRQVEKTMFTGNTAITYVYLPDGLALGRRDSELNNFFNGCTSLLQVRMPVDATTVPTGMFSGCSSLRCVEFPVSEGDSYRYGSVGNAAFHECVSLEEIVLPDGITQINDNAFGGCYSLKSVIARGANLVGDGAFINCGQLSHLELYGESPIMSGSAFTGCMSLTEITIHMPETRYEDYGYLVQEGLALYSVLDRNGETRSTLLRVLPCYEGETIDLRDDIREIEYCAMEGLRISYVEIPASVYEIETGTFRNCPNLKQVTVAEGSELITVRVNAFRNCPVLEKIDFHNAQEDLSIIGDIEDCPMHYVIMPGEDPDATPAPVLPPEEARAAFEALFDPFRAEMESRGYSYHLSMDGSELSQLIFYTNKPDMTDEDRDLLSRISHELLSSGLTGFSKKFVEEIIDFDFSGMQYFSSGDEAFDFLMIPDGTYAFTYTLY